MYTVSNNEDNSVLFATVYCNTNSVLLATVCCNSVLLAPVYRNSALLATVKVTMYRLQRCTVTLIVHCWQQCKVYCWHRCVVTASVLLATMHCRTKNESQMEYAMCEITDLIEQICSANEPSESQVV